MNEYAVVNPATDEVLETYSTFSDEQLEQALATAHRCFREWGRTASVEDRAALLTRVSELHTERREELAAITVQEMGKPLPQALEEVDFCAAIYAYYADNLATMTRDEPIELSDGDGDAVIRRAPIGVLLGIMPWNFPFYQLCRLAAPNLGLGNTVLIKPAPQCPRSAAALQQVFDDAGAPEGAFTVVRATNDQCTTLIEDRRIQGVSVTGSERAGAAVAETAGRNLKKVVLELGGSDPFIVLSTDDLGTVVESAVAARMDNTGQSCNGAKRFIVLDELHDEFVEGLVTAMGAIDLDDPTSEDAEMGPLSSTRAADRVEEQLRRAVDQGGRLAVGGTREGNYIRPGVLVDVSPDNEIYGEEIFGPIATVHRATSEEHAVELANDTDFGLGSYLFTTDREQAARVADRIEAGMVYVNLVGADAPELPFGGVKRSGFGRELGHLALEEFANKKLVRSDAWS